MSLDCKLSGGHEPCSPNPHLFPLPSILDICWVNNKLLKIQPGFKTYPEHLLYCALHHGRQRHGSSHRLGEKPWVRATTIKPMLMFSWVLAGSDNSALSSQLSFRQGRVCFFLGTFFGSRSIGSISFTDPAYVSENHTKFEWQQLHSQNASMQWTDRPSCETLWASSYPSVSFLPPMGTVSTASTFLKSIKACLNFLSLGLETQLWVLLKCDWSPVQKSHSHTDHEHKHWYIWEEN